MKTTTILGTLTTAALLSATSLAVAEGNQQKAHQQQQGQAQGQTLAQEQIDGRIVSVGKTKGTVSVETAQHGQLEFKLNPAQTQKLNEGEQLRLQIQIHSMPKQ
jgi:uncharacterized low-complexity protein